MRTLEADLVVIGAGSGGLSVAAGAAQLGLTVVLFEKGEMGGDCLNTGCVPSKALIAAANAAHAARSARALGVHAADVRVDFAAVMDHVRRVIATIAPHDSQARFEGLGCTVVREHARFTGERTVESDSVRVQARRIVIATGSRPRAPAIPGLAEAPFLTNESVFRLTELPRRLIILGGGPIGCELGQAFRRLGAEVAIVEARDFLPHDDRDLVAPVLSQLEADGVELVRGLEVERIAATPGGVALIAGDRRVEGSHLLVAAGREPVLDGLDLERAGVARDDRGVVTDRHLRSTNRRVFAVGDAAGREAFTHVAGQHAALFIRKALFAQPVDADAMVIPRVTYTDPEVAAVGESEAAARRRLGDTVKVLTVPFGGNDRAVAEGDVRGFGKLVLDRKGRLLGVGLVGAHAGELIHPWIIAMTSGLKLRDVTGFIAPYPTRGEIHKRLASAWFTPILFSDRTRLLVRLLKRF